MKRLLDHDNFSGLSTYHNYDELTDTTTLEYVQDVEPILNNNKALQNDEDYTKQGIKNEFWHYGNIPVIIQMKWLKEHNVDIYKKEDWPRILKLMNDPDYKYLKTTTKHHA